MKTTPISPADLARSVIAVPPLTRRPDDTLDRDANRALVRHLEAGGVRSLMYGGNANFYHLGVSNYAETVDMLAELVGADTWLLPSAGPYRIESYTAEDGLVLVANERWWGNRPATDTIVVWPRGTAASTASEDGRIHVVDSADKIRVRLWRHDPVKHGPTVFQVAMIPFLAYVQIAGMNPLEEVDPEDKGSYANASLVGRIAAIFAGPLANYLFASVLFFASLMVGGKPYRLTDIGVVAGMPAAAANLKDGDWQINASRVRIWAEGSGQQWQQFRERDLEVVPERDAKGNRGYAAAEVQTFNVAFR